MTQPAKKRKCTIIESTLEIELLPMKEFLKQLAHILTNVSEDAPANFLLKNVPERSPALKKIVKYLQNRIFILTNVRFGAKQCRNSFQGLIFMMTNI